MFELMISKRLLIKHNTVSNVQNLIGTLLEEFAEILIEIFQLLLPPQKTCQKASALPLSPLY